jgi:hypothetical protein
MSLQAKYTLGMPLNVQIYFLECPYKNSWQYHLTVPLKRIKGMAIPLVMLLLANLQNLVFYKGKFLKAKLENFRF